MLRMLFALIVCLLFISDASAFGRRGPGLFGRRSGCESGGCQMQQQQPAFASLYQTGCPTSCGPNGCPVNCQPFTAQPSFNFMPLQGGSVRCGPNGCTTFR